MSTLAVESIVGLQTRIRAVPAPRPVMPRERVRTLTARQRELLDELAVMFDESGFAELTMAEIAQRLSCSLRTLYELAPSRDELVLTVVDRKLRRIGRTARDAVSDDMTALDAVQTYLRAAFVAVVGITEVFTRDTAVMAPARRLNESHNDYLVAVTRALLDLAVERREIGPVDTAAVARVLAGTARDLVRPEVMPTLRDTPAESATAVANLLLVGLRSTAPRGPSTRPRTGDPSSTGRASTPRSSKEL